MIHRELELNGRPLRDFLDRILSHKGKCTFAEQLANEQVTSEGLRSRVPAKIRPLVESHFENIETLARNPCSICGTFKLKKAYVGSGCCSKECYGRKSKLHDAFVAEMPGQNMPGDIEDLLELMGK